MEAQVDMVVEAERVPVMEGALEEVLVAAATAPVVVAEEPEVTVEAAERVENDRRIKCYTCQ